MKLLVKLIVLLSFITLLSAEDIHFPKLTGRVVDNASLLSNKQKEILTKLLQEHEEKTTNQVVVVTLPTLQGYEIEEYGYQLGRYWGIGQKGKDNGILLIVAPNERKVRIEVGYGLEGVLTDKIAHDIIQEKILPFFRQKKYADGIESGTYNIVKVLSGEYQLSEETTRSKNKKSLKSSDDYFVVGFIIIFFISLIVEYFLSGEKKSTRFYVAVGIATVASVIAFIIFWHIVIAAIAWIFTFFQIIAGGLRTSGGWGSSSSFGGGSSFSGFSGGGGSFGGGGASGSW